MSKSNPVLCGRKFPSGKTEVFRGHFLLDFTPPNLWDDHRPTEWAWGDFSRGSFALAWYLLRVAVGIRAADRWAGQFCAGFVAGWGNYWVIQESEIRAWYETAHKTDPCEDWTPETRIALTEYLAGQQTFPGFGYNSLPDAKDGDK